MSLLHIVIGGVENGDKEQIDKADRKRIVPWIVPKEATPGDTVLIYLHGFGLYASAIVSSLPEKEKTKNTRYRAELKRVKRIAPAVPLEVIKAHVAHLDWAKYPRNYTTCRDEIADAVEGLA